jgi:hypothetical protein
MLGGTLEKILRQRRFSNILTKIKTKTMAKMNVYGTESYCTWICREPVEGDTDFYVESV